MTFALRQRGSLTVWFTEAAIAAWKAEPRATRGGQPRYSALAIRRRGETLPVSPPRPGNEPVHLLVDSTGLKLCGPGEWLVEKHAAKVRRSWRKLHIGVDADTGEI